MRGWLIGQIAAVILSASTGVATAQDTGSPGGQVKGSDLDNKAPTDGDVAGTGMGGTTPAMRADRSSTGGNGQSVQRPDPGTATGDRPQSSGETKE